MGQHAAAYHASRTSPSHATAQDHGYDEDEDSEDEDEEEEDEEDEYY